MRILVSDFARLWQNYRVFELRAHQRPSPLPSSPGDAEKYLYAHRSISFLLAASVVSFLCIVYSTSQLFSQRAWLLPLYALLAYTVFYFVCSTWITFLSREFHVGAHVEMVRRWRPLQYPSIDVFLPTCGEPAEVLRNTWDGVDAMRRAYPGTVVVHSLDDAHSPEVQALAAVYGFRYHARKNRGWFKKAGNLRHGFANSDSEFIVIFDADFRPRHDFLTELLPYFYADPDVAIVQSPQYFGFTRDQNWLERGAGAVQELFYRSVQVSRQHFGGAICVGSNAVYRRAALNQIGGTALVEHSEDVHTGFELRKKGWKLVYVPVILAKGLCPSELKAFFKQQYRWCSGSMSLMSSRGFWKLRLPVTTRMCYLSGFMYYIHTAIYAVFTPVIPLVMLIGLPDEIRLLNYTLIFPSFFYVHVLFPLWHRKPQGIEAAAVRIIYGWAHLFAIADKIKGSVKEWQPTGGVHVRDRNYTMFRIGALVFNFLPALAWVALAFEGLWTRSFTDFLPIYVLGLYYFLTVLKVVSYRAPGAEAAARPARLTRRARDALLLGDDLRVAA